MKELKCRFSRDKCTGNQFCTVCSVFHAIMENHRICCDYCGKTGPLYLGHCEKLGGVYCGDCFKRNDEKLQGHTEEKYEVAE